MPRQKATSADNADDVLFEAAAKLARIGAMNVLAATLEDLYTEESSVIAATLCSALTMNMALKLTWEHYKEQKAKQGEDE